MLLGNAFIHRSLCNIFQVEGKVVPRYARPLAVTTKPRTIYTAQKTHIIADKLVSAVYYNKTETDIDCKTNQAATVLTISFPG